MIEMSRKLGIMQKWKDPNMIRNISIISHVDHGKTTLSDHFIAAGGIVPKHLAGQLRVLDDLPEEQRRGITIESSYTSIIMEISKKKYLVNLIDTPGHVDFSGKVAESLRLVDGGYILVDAVEGIMAQTKTVLRQALQEKLQLVLFINKIDRLITELELTPKKIQQKIERIIGEIQSFFKKHNVEKKYYPNFSNGTIILGSALHGWAIDYKFVEKGGKISQIVDLYKRDQIQTILEKFPIMDTFTRSIEFTLPSPLVGQKMKFPSLFQSKVSDEILAKILQCDDEDNLIMMIGRSYRIQNIGQPSFIARLLSGSLKRGMLVKSNHIQDKIRITKIFQIVGKTIMDVKEAKAGQVVGIVVSKSIIPGDILTSLDISVPKINNISYVQDPVVAVSIEPLDLKDIGKLEKSIELITKVTPGLEYEVNRDTGELIAMGVGTLQLDILKSELEAQKFQLEATSPKVLNYEMPLNITNFVADKWDKIKIIAGLSELIEEVLLPIYSDNYNNKLFFRNHINKELEEGMIEVFRQYMRVSPINGKRIRNFALVILTFPEDKKLSSYENGIIIGSSLLKQALKASKTMIHEPFYELEINLPEKYLGSVLQEFYRLEIKIEDVISSESDSVIIAKLPVQIAPKLADNIRQLTDGNVFWSFNSTIFLPID